MTHEQELTNEPQPTGKAWPLSWHLGALTAALTLPMLAIIAILGWNYTQSERLRLEGEGMALARQLAGLIDRELSGDIVTLESLSVSDQLLAGDDRAFEAQARRLSAATGRHVVLRDVDGAQHFNTRLPADAELRTLPVALGDHSRGDGVPIISDLVDGGPGLGWLVLITKAVERADGRLVLLSITVPPERLHAILVSAQLPANEGSTLVDRRGIVIARWMDHNRFVGKPMPEEARSRIEASSTGTWSGANLQGRPVLVAHSRMDIVGWTVGTGVSGDRLAEPIGEALERLAPLAACLIAIAFLGTIFVTIRLNGAVDALGRSAAAVGKGDSVGALATSVTEVNCVAAVLAASSRSLASHRHRLERIALSAPNIIYIHDLEVGRNLYTNDQIETTLGLTSQELVELPAGFLSDMLHPDDRLRVETSLETLRDLPDGAVHEVEYRLRHKDGTYRWLLSRDVAFKRDNGGRVAQILGAAVDITDIKRTMTDRALLMREMQHRVKNTLAAVVGIASATARSSPSMQAFKSAFADRIRSLAATHSLLFDSQHQVASLADLVRSELAPFTGDHGESTGIDGPLVLLHADAATAVGMAIHELTTNAIKYGALSADGRIDVSWTTEKRGGTVWLIFEWQESGGPSVSEPSRRGFGSQLLQDLLSQKLQAKVDIHFRPEGLRFRFEMPLEEPSGPVAG